MNHPRKRVKTTGRASTKAPSKADIGAPVPLPKPNVADPLSEPTRHRRIWAAYLSRGMTRRDFAEALGTNYHTVNRWDAGAATISLDMLQKASEILHYSMDDLCFGRTATQVTAVSAESAAASPRVAAAPAAPHAPTLTEADIRALFDTHRVDATTRAAFGEHAASPAGRYQSFTAEYVEAWCAAYAFARDEQAALEAGVKSRALGNAVMHGQVPVTAEALRAAHHRAAKT